MRQFIPIIALLVVLVLPHESWGQRQFQSIRPSGIKGSVGFGLAEYSVLSPAQDFRLDDGIYTSVAGETALGAMGLHVTIGLNYLKTTGRTNYDYSTLSENYTVSDISFDTSTFQVALGLKLKPFTAILSPYVEGGGFFGYQEIVYTNRTAELQAQGNNFKRKDGLTETGYYGDAGVEVTFSERFGVRAGYKYIKSESRPFVTLGDQKVKYDARVFHFGVITQF